MDSYPGSYGQDLTNLFLNAVNHAFPDGQAGSIIVEARQAATRWTSSSDDGVGMTEEVQRRALDPFFTTRRGAAAPASACTSSTPWSPAPRRPHRALVGLGAGTRFRITLPRVAPGSSAWSSPRRSWTGGMATTTSSPDRDEPGDEAVRLRRRWKVAVIDDDPAVHDGTRFALYDYVLNGQGLEILSAYSAAEGRSCCRAHPDMAVVLLDVVMESDTAGLDLVDFIRKELKNETVRIILRTGQPGQAPERRVIVDYDINDYKAKTELTADKLFTPLTAALRGYQQLQRMVETRRGLEIIIDAASRCSTSGRCSACGGCPDPDRIPAQRRLRRHPGPARSRQGDERAARSSRARAAPRVPRPRSGGRSTRRPPAVQQAFARRRHEFRTSARFSTSRPAAAAGRGAPRSGQVIFRRPTGARRGILQPAVHRLRQRHPL